MGENQCIPIPKEMPLTAAALIGCGVITGTGAVFNRANGCSSATPCVVIGAGGVGLNVIQGAEPRAAPARSSPSTAFPRRKPSPREFGATDFILAEGDDFDAVKEVKSRG